MGGWTRRSRPRIPPGSWVAAGRDGAWPEPVPPCPRLLSGSLGKALAWPDPALQRDLVYSGFLTRSRHGSCAAARRPEEFGSPRRSSAAVHRALRSRPPAAPISPQARAATGLLRQLLVHLGLPHGAMCCVCGAAVCRVMETWVCVTKQCLLMAGHQQGPERCTFWRGEVHPSPPRESRAGNKIVPGTSCRTQCCGFPVRAVVARAMC